MHVIQDSNSFLILAKVFGGLGSAFVLVAAVMAVIRAKRLSGCITASGTVVDFHQTGWQYRPVIEFTPPGQNSVRFESPIGSNPPRFQKGESVPVRYSPTNPSNAFIDRFWHLWFFPALFGIIGIPFLIVSVMMWIWGVK